MAYCKNCGKEIESDAVFCPYCGVSVQDAQDNSNEISFCMKCGRKLETGQDFCPVCGTPAGSKGTPYYQQMYGAPPVQEDKTIMEKFTSSINSLADGNGAVKIKLKDLFSTVFKKHNQNESESIFTCGTSQTTPPVSLILTQWPKPWLFSRIFAVLFFVVIILNFIFWGSRNPIVIPNIMFIGSLLMPLSVLVFFFETNIPRNISIYNTIKVFFMGGVLSLLTTTLFYEFFSDDMINSYIGTVIIGLVEEIGKVVIVAHYLSRQQKKGRLYLLNGILIGAAVGAGFAAFESAGYAFNTFYESMYSSGDTFTAYLSMSNVILLRGVLAPGGHVAWAAISGFAIALVTNENSFVWTAFFKKKFLLIFLIPIVLHALWDVPVFMVVKDIILTILVWIVLLVFTDRGINQINELVEKQQTE